MITNDPNPPYSPNANRYTNMLYNKCGSSGIKLPAISLGLWQNFGGVDSLTNAKSMLCTAFDLGVCHFDLANNYGPPFGSAEATFGEVLRSTLKPFRDELFISSKAGYDMWPGPYGDGGSRKYLISSCEQSLKRTGLDYFDVFYSHCFDAQTPLEETMGALDTIVKSGKALYAGVSSYSPQQTLQAIEILKGLGTPMLVHQPSYNMFDRWIEDGLDQVLLENGVGAVVFSSLAQGFLTDKYLDGIPSNSRAARADQIYLDADSITQDKIQKVRALNLIAKSRDQSLAQMAIAWNLLNPAVTSCLVGASSSEQIIDSVKSLDNLSFSKEDLSQILQIIA